MEHRKDIGRVAVGPLLRRLLASCCCGRHLDYVTLNTGQILLENYSRTKWRLRWFLRFLLSFLLALQLQWSDSVRWNHRLTCCCCVQRSCTQSDGAVVCTHIASPSWIVDAVCVHASLLSSSCSGARSGFCLRLWIYKSVWWVLRTRELTKTIGQNNKLYYNLQPLHPCKSFALRWERIWIGLAVRDSAMTNKNAWVQQNRWLLWRLCGLALKWRHVVQQFAEDDESCYFTVSACYVLTLSRVWRHYSAWQEQCQQQVVRQVVVTMFTDWVALTWRTSFDLTSLNISRPSRVSSMFLFSKMVITSRQGRS